MTVLEHLKNLSHSLTPKQRDQLAKYLEKPNGKPAQKKPVSLRGSWKGKFPDNVDIEAMIREIRDEWKEELSLHK
ncbi:MAG: hypothetical protein ABIV48_10210 [Pyrinomonadaceae bacterium]